jgi:uncharacterized membrane protein
MELAVARTRVFVAAVVGLVVFGVTMPFAPWQVAVMASWDTAAAVVVAWVIAEIWTKNSAETATLAVSEDNSRAAADALLLLSGVASLVGVGVVLVKAAQSSGGAKAGITVLAASSVVLSWAVVSTVFVLRYAHLYYSGTPGGIDFNDDTPPDYRDFVYIAVTIGMTYQTSDTNITTKEIRRAVTQHALLSYLFGTGVVAVMINVVASLIR